MVAWDYLNSEISYGEFSDVRDDQVYKTVKIGNQTWMAENLNYSVNAGTQSWCGGGSGDEEGDCSEYGRLYTWAAAIDSVALANDADDPLTCGYGVECTLPATVQGICPSGWHLPDYEEWEALITAVGGKDKAGKALKSQTGWTSFENLSAFTDDYGFSALPAGRKYCGSSFKSVDDEAYFWSASLYKESKKWNAYYMSLRYSLFSANLDDESKDNGYSVRCLKD